MGKLSQATVARKAATSWYSEIKDYDFTTTECSGGRLWNNFCGNKYVFKFFLLFGNFLVCGHFTQLVWKNSKKLGLGLAQVVKGGWASNYVVARYDPRGNFHMVGQKVKDYQANVAPKA